MPSNLFNQPSINQSAVCCKSPVIHLKSSMTPNKTIKKDIHHCKTCGHLTDQEICNICSNEHRNESILMVVESPKDVFTIEKAGEYKGYYHVLNGVISPMDGYGPEDINLTTLWPRIANHNIKEIIIATSSTQEGETTALYISRILKDILLPSSFSIAPEDKPSSVRTLIFTPL